MKQQIVKVASYQVHPGKYRQEQLKAILQETEAHQIDFLCLPEGFLTGYYSEEEPARENSIEVGSPLFEEWLALFKPFSATVIVGFNEKEGDLLFDSAAIIEKGELLGVQRKHFLYHKYFSQGTSFSVFQSKGLRIGVTICLDTIYFEPSRLLAEQGAHILFSPMCNIVSNDHPYAKRPPYYSHLVARSFERLLERSLGPEGPS